MKLLAAIPLVAYTAQAATIDWDKVLANISDPTERQKAKEAFDAAAILTEEEQQQLDDQNDRLQPGQTRAWVYNANGQKIKIKKSNTGSKLNLITIKDYGCWCRSSSDRDQVAIGRPVDVLDAACKAYTIGNRCLARDHPNCDFEGLDYTDYVRADWNGYLEFYCSETPDAGVTFDQCSYDVCIVELQGINDQIKALQDYGRSDQFNHASGFVPSRDNCSTPGGGPGIATKPDSCCGFYPYRDEYNSGGTRACCGWSGKLYSSLLEECCFDGSIMPMGQC